jgi:hypothetical protein
MNGCVAQQSPRRLHNRLPSRSDGGSQGRREPARPARTLDGQPARRLSLRAISDASLKADTGDLSTVRGSLKLYEPVLRAQHDRPERLLSSVVVDFEPAVFRVARQGDPVAQRVADGCTERTLR